MEPQDKKINFKISIPFPVKDDRYKNASLSKIEDLTDTQSEDLSKWIENPKNFLFLHSPFGRGKTYIASAIAIFFYQKNIPVYMFNEYELFKLLETHQFQGQHRSWKISGICENPIVIWDDFGSTIKGGKNDYNENENLNLMYQFIDERYNKGLPTIITSNFTIDELGQKINERISSRLNATENLILEIIGSDKRQEGL